MASVYQNRVGLEFARGRCSRAQLKAFDQFLKTHPLLSSFYTGMVGRRFCFHFETPALLQEFVEEATPAFENLGLGAGSFQFVV